MSLKIKEKKFFQITCTFIGVFITGISIGLFRYVGMGMDPYSTMVSGTADLLSISYGNMQLCCALILFLVQLRYYRKSIGIGTAFNLFFIGYISDFALSSFNILSLPNTYIFKFLWIALGIIIVGIGMGLYTSTELGIAPYDSIAFIISNKKNIPFSICRIISDLFCLMIGLSFGAPIGITTVIMMIGTGPLVSCFSGVFVKVLK